MTDELRTAVIDDNADLSTSIMMFDEWAQYDMKRHRLPGMCVGIAYKGELIWAKPYGYANLESETPVTLNTRFRIASISKTFTATAILQLRDAGKLKLDDPVADYLDWFTVSYKDSPPITIRHLLTHTSGLPRDGARPIWEDDDFHDWDEVKALMPQRVPTMPPLEDFSYSNLGYTLLGAIIEAVSGKSWGDTITENILNPLEMHDTLPAARGGEPNLATGYLRESPDGERSGVGVVDARAYDAATGMASTVPDLAKYAYFHLSKDNHALLSAYSLRDMHRPHWTSADWSGGYGLGTVQYRVGDLSLSGHSGGYKGYITMFTLDRKSDFAAIVLTNAIDSMPMEYIQKLYKFVYPEVVKLDAKSHKASPDWAKLTGRYVSDWVDMLIVVRHNRLEGRSLAFIDIPPLYLNPTDDPMVFTIEVPGNPGETAHFEFNEATGTMRLWMRNEYADRVE